jgi:hypothetical protein
VEQKKQYNPRKVEAIRDTQLGFRTTKRIKALAEIAALEQGMTLSTYVELLLQASFDSLHVDGDEDDREANPGSDAPSRPITYTGGRPLSIAADDLYDDDDVTCLFKRVLKPRYLSGQQLRMLDLLRLSHTFHSKRGVFNESAIRQHWDTLIALLEGKPVIESKRNELFPDVDIEFALMSESQRISLYKSNPEEFTRRSQAHIKKSKRSGN